MVPFFWSQVSSILILVLASFKVVNSMSCECDNKDPMGGKHRTCVNGTCSFDENDTMFEPPRCYISDEDRGCITLFVCYYFIHNPEELKLKCCFGDMCNKNITIDEIKPNPDVEEVFPSKTRENLNDRDDDNDAREKRGEVLFLKVGVPILVVFVIVCSVFWKKLINRNNAHLAKNSENCDDSTCSVNYGAHVLMEMTISWQIQLKENIGSGSFGNVYRGVFRGMTDVAVKILTTDEEKSWEQEKDLYLTTAFNHANILGFRGADRRDDGVSTQLWIVFDYHTNGSLYDYLNAQSVKTAEMLKLVRGMVNGLEYLHKPIASFGGKPSIAHRDFKTKNILVKKDGTCCIADFGLAIKDTKINDNNKLSLTAGTCRYQSPEILDRSMNINWFASFRMADVYAFGLCLWEVCRRTVVEGKVKEYQLPYFKDVPSNPTEEVMKEAVCTFKKRPRIQTNWSMHKVMNLLSEIMKECWYEDPRSRITMARIRINLSKADEEELEVNTCEVGANVI